MNITNVISEISEWSRLRAADLADQRWDAQLELDGKAGLLDDLQREALEDFHEGRTTEL